MTLARTIAVESANVLADGTPATGLTATLHALEAQLAADDEVVLTDAGLDAATLRAARTACPRLRVVPVRPGTTYYDHKNAGVVAARAPVVLLLDGDCAPQVGWLDALAAPLRAGAAAVAGVTRYPPSPVAVAATAIDFARLDDAGGARTLFANNCAFRRELALRYPFPATPGLSKGACQLLALQLRGRGVRLERAPAAVVHHAMPRGRAWLAMRLRRGADARAIAPTLVAAYVPGLGAEAARLPPCVLGLALLALRGAHGTARTLLDAASVGERLAGAGFLAAATLVDGVGALRGARYVDEPSAAAGAPAA
jgi:hypothetical protein